MITILIKTSFFYKSAQRENYFLSAAAQLVCNMWLQMLMFYMLLLIKLGDGQKYPTNRPSNGK